jgi:hypothetical protein
MPNIDEADRLARQGTRRFFKSFLLFLLVLLVTLGLIGYAISVFVAVPMPASTILSPSNASYTGAVASQTLPCRGGDVFYPTNSYAVYRCAGSAWVPWGLGFPMVEAPAAGWSWINQGTATVSTVNGGIYLRSVATTGRQFRIRTRARPSDPTVTPYTIDAALIYHLPPRSPANAGIGWRQSSDGKLAMALLVFDSTTNHMTFVSQKCTSATVFSANYASEGHMGSVMNPQLVFLRLIEDATTRQIWWSNDGQEYTLFHSVGRTDFLTADEVCFSVDSENTVYDAGMRVASWYVH